MSNSVCPIALVQEPHVNSRNVISKLSRDMILISMLRPTRRPRACIFAHKSLRSKLWLMDSLSNEDCVVVQTTINETKCLIISCYMDRNDTNCPPAYLHPVVDYAKKHNIAFILGTDANAHHGCWNSSTINDKGRGNNLLDFMAKDNLTWENVGCTPTFDNGRWQNVIDLTITNTKGHDLVSDWWVDNRSDTINCSDHNFINFKIKSSTGVGTSRFRDIAKTDWVQYKELLEASFAGTDLGTRQISSQEDIDRAGEEFTDLVTSAFHAACDEQYVSSKLRKTPWETKEVGEAKKELRHRLRKARNTKADKDWSELRSHQAQYKKLVKSTRTTTWREFCRDLDAKSNSKKISAVIKNNKSTKLGTVRDAEGKLTESPEETLEVLTKTHFKGGVTIADADSNPNSAAHTAPPHPEEKQWDPSHLFSEKRAAKAIAEFDPLSAAGPDGLRPVMLQQGWDVIGKALTNIVRSSYVVSVIPKCWKNSTGIFLPKPGKNDYYNPKSYRTITLAPVPLKFLERLVQWHMEVDLKMETVLHRNQFGFRKGLSTEAALHIIVNKLENQILKGEFALGTFLDIEGAFDNVSTTAISRALDKYCPSTTVNNWIRTLIKSRSTTVELHGARRTIISHRGCPQGGILSPLLWNLVMNNLFSFTRNKLPCDLQGFADDLLLLARGFDADTLRDVTQRSLNAIEEWCLDNDLTISTSKTHSVMFTRKQKWKLARPLVVHGKNLKLKESTKFLGITLDQKLTWNSHIEKQTQKAKSVLMMCKTALGPTWGFTPATMKWIYTAIVRPMLAYGAPIWINGLNNQSNQKALNSVQRLSHIMTTGGLPSTSLVSLDKILNTLPIEIFLREQAANCAARLKAQGNWELASESSSNGRLQRHSSILEKLHQKLPFNGEPMDLSRPKLNLENNFKIVIPAREDFPGLLYDFPPSTVQCYTDGSKMEEKVGAGFVVYKNNTVIMEKAFHLGAYSTVFQAETTAISQTARYLLSDDYTNTKIIILSDSQASLKALDSTKIKTRTIQEAVETLNRLGECNDLSLMWIPAHSDYEGNEKADTLAKKGSRDDDAIRLKLPTPQATWKTFTHSLARKEAEDRWKSTESTHFKRTWKDKYSRDLANMGRQDLRIATQLLSGHAAVNYHLHKYKPITINKTCPFCQEEDETINHYVGKCPRWFVQRGQYFNTYYASISEIMDRSSLTKLIQFARATGRLEPNFESPDGNGSHINPAAASSPT